MVCMCGADGLLACGPCGGTGATGGTAGRGRFDRRSGERALSGERDAGGGRRAAVLGHGGLPRQTDYRVRCDGNGACMCFVKGAPTSTMPALSCSGLVPSVALMACGFPRRQDLTR